MPFYFNYQNKIYHCLKTGGATVYLIDEDVNEQSIWSKFISIYWKKGYERKLQRYYRNKFYSLPDQLDYILVIKGSTLDEEKIKYLRKKYKNARFIIYQWDSVANFPKAAEIAPYFDFKYTFDPEDAKCYGWYYRALFFEPEECRFDYHKKYDLVLICSLHSERAELYKKLKILSKKENMNFFGYLFSNKWSFLRQKYFKKNNSFYVKKKDLKFIPLSEKVTSEIYNCSRCLVDYKFPKQKGLTMRSIESIGHKCKLITNNAQIENEDFYNPQNILIYNIDNFNIPKEFIYSDYQDIPEKIYQKYTVQGWVEEIFK